MTVRLRERDFSHEWRWACPEPACGWNAWEPDALRSLTVQATALVAGMARARNLSPYHAVRAAVAEVPTHTPVGSYLAGLRPEERGALAADAGRLLVEAGMGARR